VKAVDAWADEALWKRTLFRKWRKPLRTRVLSEKRREELPDGKVDTWCWRVGNQVTKSHSSNRMAFFVASTNRLRWAQRSQMNGQNRKDIRPGLTVDIILKADQRTGKRTRGVVQDILTSSPTHPHGIKVRLQDGQVGRVCAIVS